MNDGAMPRCLISGDWGTSSLRVRLVGAGGADADCPEVRQASGAASLSRGEGDRAARFRHVLEEAVTALLSGNPGFPAGSPVVVSGMASSSIGWQEVPYARLPFRLDAGDVQWASPEPLHAGGSAHPVFLLSGVRDAEDVMRGEETELIGLARAGDAGSALEDATVILPGTHSKHVRVRNGVMTGFRTFMTGELFNLLAEHSVLREAVDRGAPVAWPDFERGVRDALVVPLSAAAFRVRSRHVLRTPARGDAGSYLSGLLIGAELAALVAPGAAAGRVILCGGLAVSDSYAAAAGLLGLARRLTVVPPQRVDRLAMHGHAQALERLAGSKPA